MNKHNHKKIQKIDIEKKDIIDEENREAIQNFEEMPIKNVLKKRKNNGSIIIGGMENFVLNNDEIKLEIQKVPTKIYALGGIEEIGKNMYCIEYDDEIVIIDCGIKFADKTKLPGVNGLIPNFDHLIKNKEKVKALIITHGHEDHIGGIPFLVEKISIPVIYTPIIAAELIKRKLNEQKNAKPYKLVFFADDSVFETKHFKIDFYRVNHSVPDSFGVVVFTPNGIVASTGDFRFDFESNGDEVDLHKVVEVSKRGVKVLLCETTNATIPSFNESAKEAVNEINRIIRKTKGRVIISSFSSNLGRIEEIIQYAISLGRKILILGRSMEANINASKKVGYLELKEGDIIEAREINNFLDQQLLVLCTGSQGEENAALNTMAIGRHPWISLKSTDTVILSSNPIPGNLLNVEKLINKLYKIGLKVYQNSVQRKIHSTGHANKLEHQLFISTMKPEYVVPVHGEYKMLYALRSSIEDMGINRKKIFIINNGEVLYLLNGILNRSNERVEANPVFVDGRNSSLLTNKIIEERKELGRNGILVILIIIDHKKREIDGLPVINTRGSFYAKEAGALISKISKGVKEEVDELLKIQTKIDEGEITKKVEEIVNQNIWKQKNKKPIVKLIIWNNQELTNELFKPKITSQEEPQKDVN